MFTVEKQIKSYGGIIYKLQHQSESTKTPMKLNVFIPPQSDNSPVIFYLAGLTCTGDNGLEKGNFLKPCADKNIAIVFPDTSPRTNDSQTLPNEHESYDFGSGAGFYLNATAEPYNQFYNMEKYIADELPKALETQFQQLNWKKVSIMGHSMGGHGALTLFLNHPGKYQSVSAFAPICNPTKCPWGEKAFINYLGSVDAGSKYDATDILKKLGSQAPKAHTLIDVGTGDQFYKDKQLLPENLVEAAKNTGFEVKLRVHEDYDHSYFFISTFAEDHIIHHAKALGIN